MDLFAIGTEPMTSTRTANLQLAILCLILGAVLIPFSGKAIHLDDPLFIWTGMQLQHNPLDFYGFTVNWYGSPQPMAEVMKNPPLFAYYLALAGGVAGWSEQALHLACLLPALAAAIGTWLLAREFGVEPLLATLAGLLTPVFLISATTVMCDVTLVAFWVWGVWFWVRGCDRSDPRLLVVAALLTAGAGLTKYFGVSLIPLLALYSLSARERRHTLPYLLVPVAILAGYQLWTGRLYGTGLLLDAAGYSAKTRNLTPAGMLAALTTGLSYTGGGLLTPLCLFPLLGGRRLPLAGGVLTAALLLIALSGDLNGYRPGLADGRWFQGVQLTLFTAAGIGVLVLAAVRFNSRRDGKTLLLAAWIFGTFLFACCFNWTVSGRNILPLAPAVGMLLAGGLRPVDGSRPRSLAAAATALAASLAVSLWVVVADSSVAGAARQAAAEITGRHGKGGRMVHFQGHWGFQYYMQKSGAKPIDFTNAALAAGDVMVVPKYGTNIRSVNSAGFSLVETVSIPLAAGVSTMDAALGAGFYMSRKAALPYAFGPVAPAQYDVFLFAPGSAAVTER